MPAATQTAGVVGAVIVVTGTALVLAAQKFGVFKKVKWEEGPMQEQNIVYVEHKGPYQNIGKAFEKLSKDLEAAGIPVTKNSHTFVGVYKDDPAKVPAEELQSLAGVVLDEEDSKKSGLPSKKYAAQKTLQTMFPYYGILSIMLAVYKCYSGLPKAMGETCKDNATAEDSYGECIEVYEAATNTMTFHVVRK